MFLIYRVVTWMALILAPFYVLGALIRRPRHWQDIGGRFGLLPPSLIQAARKGIWVQAASVGELQMARSLVAALQKTYPQVPVIVSVTTPAALRLLERPIPGTAGSMTFPLDLPPVVWRTVSLLQPRLFVAMETEVWPNLYESLRRRDIPVALVNGCISQRSFSRYRRVRRLISRALGAVHLVCARGQIDAARFQDLGVPPERIVVTGDLKFDSQAPQAKDIPRRLKDLLAGNRVVVAGSTHPGEESVVLEAARLAAVETGNVLVVLAPRHLHRLQETERLLLDSGLPWKRRSSLEDSDGDEVWPEDKGPRVLLLDTHGELGNLYAMADVALLGGTLAPVGGHNPLEAAAAGVPIVSGPHVANVADTVQLLEQAGGLLRAADGTEVSQQLARLLSNRSESRQRGQAARSVLAGHRGSLERILSNLRSLLKPAN